MKLQPLSMQKESLKKKQAPSQSKNYRDGFLEGIEESFKQFKLTIELYRKYKDNVKLLMEEQNNVWRKWVEYYEKQKNIDKDNFLQRYNDWLFSYIFDDESSKEWIKL